MSFERRYKPIGGTLASSDFGDLTGNPAENGNYLYFDGTEWVVSDHARFFHDQTTTITPTLTFNADSDVYGLELAGSAGTMSATTGASGSIIASSIDHSTHAITTAITASGTGSIILGAHSPPDAFALQGTTRNFVASGDFSIAGGSISNFFAVTQAGSITASGTSSFARGLIDGQSNQFANDILASGDGAFVLGKIFKSSSATGPALVEARGEVSTVLGAANAGQLLASGLASFAAGFVITNGTLASYGVQATGIGATARGVITGAVGSTSAPALNTKVVASGDGADISSVCYSSNCTFEATGVGSFVRAGVEKNDRPGQTIRAGGVASFVLASSQASNGTVTADGNACALIVQNDSGTGGVTTASGNSAVGCLGVIKQGPNGTTSITGSGVLVVGNMTNSVTVNASSAFQLGFGDLTTSNALQVMDITTTGVMLAGGTGDVIATNKFQATSDGAGLELGASVDAHIFWDGTNNWISLVPNTDSGTGHRTVTIGNGTAAKDYRLRFDGATADGILEWDDSADTFVCYDHLRMGTGNGTRLEFGGAAEATMEWGGSNLNLTLAAGDDNFQIQDQASTVRFRFVTHSTVDANNFFDVRDGGNLRWYDSTNNDTVVGRHDGTDFNWTSTGTTEMNFDMRLRAQDDLYLEGMLRGVPTELTISAGAVTVDRFVHTIDTEADATTDDLDTINGGVNGQVVILSAQASSRDPTLKDGTGNLALAGDFTLSNVRDMIMLRYHSGTGEWCEVSRSDNA